MMGKHPDGPYDWAEFPSYHSPPLHSPAHEIGGFCYPAVSPHEMHSESPFGRHPHMYGTSQQPQPVFPAQWPSAMVTHASMQAPPPPHPPPPQPSQHVPLQPPLAPMNAMPSGQGLPQLNTAPQQPPQQQPIQRRTLTDQDRRRMCQYHEENPSVKQTEIGGMSGTRSFTALRLTFPASNVWCGTKVCQDPTIT